MWLLQTHEFSECMAMGPSLIAYMYVILVFTTSFYIPVVWTLLSRLIFMGLDVPEDVCSYRRAGSSIHGTREQWIPLPSW